MQEDITNQNEKALLQTQVKNLLAQVGCVDNRNIFSIHRVYVTYLINKKGGKSTRTN
jgi:hypothetical protein